MNNFNKGRVSYASGNFFEKVIQSQLELYKLSGVAVIDKINEERVKDSFVYKKRLHVDFIGYTKYYNGEKFDRAVSVGIEVKNVSSTYFKFSMVKQHQIDYLYNLHKNGGIALLLIGFPNENIIIKLIVNEKVFSMFDEKKTIKDTYSGGKNIKDLISITGEGNTYSFQNLDFMGFSDKFNII